MAITKEWAAEDGNNPTEDFSITLPTTVSGDILVLEVAIKSATFPTLGGTFSETLTQKHQQVWVGGSSWVARLYWGRCTGDHSGETITGDGVAGSDPAAHVIGYRGALATGSPLADTTSVGENNASGDETQAQITTTTDGAMVCLAVINQSLNVTVQAATDPSALTERNSVLNTSGPTRIDHASAIKTTAGATGAFTWSQFDGEGGSFAYAITPAAAATGAVSPLAGDSRLHSSALTRSGLMRRSMEKINGLWVPSRRLIYPRFAFAR